MELRDTVEMMVSKDYKERFKAEFYQLKIRYESLKAMLEKWDLDMLDFKPSCPRDWYDEQLQAMADYLMILKDRADLEEVDVAWEGEG